MLVTNVKNTRTKIYFPALACLVFHLQLNLFHHLLLHLSQHLCTRSVNKIQKCTVVGEINSFHLLAGVLLLIIMVTLKCICQLSLQLVWPELTTCLTTKLMAEISNISKKVPFTNRLHHQHCQLLCTNYLFQKNEKCSLIELVSSLKY